MGKIAVVTGASGFIGANLVRELIKRDWDVIALHRPNSNLFRLAGLPITLRAADITETESLKRVVHEGADALFHLAADPRITRRMATSQSTANVVGTKNMLDTAIEKRVKRFLFTSSMGAFGIHDARIDESAASNAMRVPINYFRTKYLGELEVDRAIDRGLDAVIVNPSNVLGPFDVKNMPATYIRLVHQSKIHFIGPGSASFCHVREVARAMISAVERGGTGERYLLGGADATFLEWGRIIQQVVGGRAPRIAVPGWAFRLAAATLTSYARATGRHTILTPEIALIISKNMLVDSSKAERELGFRPVPFRKMVEDEVLWLRKNKLLDQPALWAWSTGQGL